MLAQLLGIKRRRERGLRSGLARLEEDDSRLRGKQTALHDRRVALHDELRALAATHGHFSQRGLAGLRTALAKLESEDQALLRQQKALITEREQLAQTRAEQDLLLRGNLREQEKLDSILEDM